MDIIEAQKLVQENGKKLQNDGLVTATWGNISHRIDSRRMAITPSGISYDELNSDQIVIVDMHDLSYEGNLKPSSETGMHAAILRKYPEINAVIHTHSLYAGIVAAKGTEVPPYLEDMAQVIGPSIRIVPHALTGSPELSEGVLKALDGRYGAILQNHGAVCMGRDMKEAFAACHILEKSCQIFINIQLLGGGKPLAPEQAEYFRDFYLNHYQKK